MYFWITASPAFSWIDDYEDFLKDSKGCCYFHQNNGSVCYSEDVKKGRAHKKQSVIQSWTGDHLDWDIDEDFPSIDDDDEGQISEEASPTNGQKVSNKNSKAKHELHLDSDNHFSAYDDYYYYDDDDTGKRSKRDAPNPRVLRCQDYAYGGTCCKCLPSRTPVDETNFKQFYKIFLTDNPNQECPKSGHAAYGDAVRPVQVPGPKNLNDEYDKFFPPMMINASNFMAFHTILKTSKDYYEALRWARKLTSELEDTINRNLTEEEKVKVFPYSVFYVFYEQYLTM